MTDFIDLERRFHILTDTELEDTELLLAWSGYEFSSDTGWSDLLESSRVVLLAEAGAGKTAEMREQARRLAEENKFAFFMAVESLDQESVSALLSSVEERRFEAWKADGEALAWFFLDAVDELKLTRGKLDRALRRLSKSIDGHLDRARIVISCRPSDWRPSRDLPTVQHILPISKRDSAAPSRSPEEVFTAVRGAIRHGRYGRVSQGCRSTERLDLRLSPLGYRRPDRDLDGIGASWHPGSAARDERHRQVEGRS